jgi:catechol 2,3-dioxygenase-like lactoylglutathione lyase family enzyme
MFEYTEAFSSFAVDDLAEAKQFYADVLGMPVSGASSHRDGAAGGTGDDLLRLDLGGGKSVLVYAKPHHTPAAFTILSFLVADINEAVDELARRGIRFERYPDLSFDDKGIHRGDVHAVAPVAWFTDPAGNILSVIEKV